MDVLSADLELQLEVLYTEMRGEEDLVQEEVQPIRIRIVSCQQTEMVDLGNTGLLIGDVKQTHAEGWIPSQTSQGLRNITRRCIVNVE